MLASGLTRAEWGSLAIGVVGIGGAVWAASRLRAPRRLRPNWMGDRDLYNEWLDKVCKGRIACDKARAQEFVQEELFLQAQQEHDARLEHAQKSVERSEQELALLRKQALDIQNAFVRFHREAAALQLQMSQIDKKKDWSAWYRASRQHATAQEYEENFSWRLERQFRRLEEAQQEHDHNEQELSRIRAGEHLQERISALEGMRITREQLCAAFEKCARRYPTFEEWMRVRREREARLTDDPLRLPLSPQHARFGVELEVVHATEWGDKSLQAAIQAVEQAVGGTHVQTAPYARTQSRAGELVLDKAGREWKVVADNSLPSGGWEIVTPVLAMRDIATVQRLAEKLRQAGFLAEPYLDTGLHVHTSHPSMGSRLPAIAREAARLDASVRRAEKRTKEWAKHLPEQFTERLHAGMSERDVIELWYETASDEPPPEHPIRRHPSRYHGVNFHAYPYMGTIETRAWDGTLDPDAIRRAIVDSVKMTLARLFKNARTPRARVRRAA